MRPIFLSRLLEEITMSDSKHQWEYFSKGRIKVRACVKCGDINHSTNNDQKCTKKSLGDTLIARAGYRLSSAQAS